jgi:hypothetical protein
MTMGRPRTFRGVVDEYLSLSVSDLCRSRTTSGQVIWHSCEGEELFAVLFQLDEKRQIEPVVTVSLPTHPERTYHIGLCSARQFSGGHRLWFRCPGLSGGLACERRALLLYIDPVIGEIGCRTCLGLTYASSRASHRYDALFSLAERVGVAMPDLTEIHRVRRRAATRSL